MTISIEQAQIKLAELIDKSAHGEQVVITKDGHSVAEIVPSRRPDRREPGSLKGKIRFLVDENDKSHLADFKEYME